MMYHRFCEINNRSRGKKKPSKPTSIRKGKIQLCQLTLAYITWIDQSIVSYLSVNLRLFLKGGGRCYYSLLAHWLRCILVGYWLSYHRALSRFKYVSWLQSIITWRLITTLVVYNMTYIDIDNKNQIIQNSTHHIHHYYMYHLLVHYRHYLM